MATLHRIFISDSAIDEVDGITTFDCDGEEVLVAGVRYVQTATGSLIPAVGYHADRQAAVLDAADRIERLGMLLVSQSARMRSDARK